MNTTTESTQKRGRGRPQRRILTPTEVEGFKDLISSDKAMKTETDEFYPSVPNMPKSEQIKRVEKTLSDGEVDSINKWDKNKLEKRAAELKEWLVKNMVPRSHIGLRISKDGVQSIEFQKAKNFMAQKEMSSEFQKMAIEYKNIMRRLERPEEANLENIRPETN